MKFPNILDIMTSILVAIFLLSFVYVAINGRGSSPSGWGQYYESAGR